MNDCGQVHVRVPRSLHVWVHFQETLFHQLKLSPEEQSALGASARNLVLQSVVTHCIKKHEEDMLSVRCFLFSVLPDFFCLGRQESCRFLEKGNTRSLLSLLCGDQPLFSVTHL